MDRCDHCDLLAFLPFGCNDLHILHDDLTVSFYFIVIIIIIIIIV